MNKRLCFYCILQHPEVLVYLVGQHINIYNGLYYLVTQNAVTSVDLVKKTRVHSPASLHGEIIMSDSTSSHLCRKAHVAVNGLLRARKSPLLFSQNLHNLQ